MIATSIQADFGAGWQAITGDWAIGQPVTIDRGLRGAVARVGRLRLALWDRDGAYTPDHPNVLAGWGLATPLRIAAGGHLLLTGRVAALTRRGDLTWVDVEDDMAVLARARLDAFDLTYNATPGSLITALLAGLFTPLAPADYDTGVSEFTFAGDTFRAGMLVITAVEQVCQSEGGRFYLRAGGGPRFEGRHARLARTTPDATLGAVEVAEERAYLITDVQAEVTPRELAPQLVTLWEPGAPLELAAGATQVIVARFRDPDEPSAEIAGAGIATPVTGWYASTKATGGGLQLTAQVDLSVELGARSARLTFTNNAGVTLFVHGLALTGQPLRRFPSVSVRVEDAAALAAYGPHPLRLDMPVQDSVQQAEDLARGLLLHHSDPLAWPTITLEAAASAQALQRDVGDLVALADGRRVFIERIQHRIEGLERHTVTWGASPADPRPRWLLGVAGRSELGETTVLGY